MPVCGCVCPWVLLPLNVSALQEMVQLVTEKLGQDAGVVLAAMLAHASRFETGVNVSARVHISASCRALPQSACHACEGLVHARHPKLHLGSNMTHLRWHLRGGGRGHGQLTDVGFHTQARAFARLWAERPDDFQSNSVSCRCPPAQTEASIEMSVGDVMGALTAAQESGRLQQLRDDTTVLDQLKALSWDSLNVSTSLRGPAVSLSPARLCCCGPDD